MHSVCLGLDFKRNPVVMSQDHIVRGEKLKTRKTNTYLMEFEKDDTHSDLILVNVLVILIWKKSVQNL